MSNQLLNSTAILFSESATTSYYVGGTFSLGAGPFTELELSAQDDDTDFGSLGAQFHETDGAGRQTGTLTDSSGASVQSGLSSLREVLTLTHPVTGNTVLVGRVEIYEDNGGPGTGALLEDVLIFSAPIDPSVTYNVTAIEYSPGGSGSNSYTYSQFDSGSVVCFAAGTMILTRQGYKPIETLQVGDKVQTADNGLQPILWLNSQCFSYTALKNNPRLFPVQVNPGRLGNSAPLLVSRQHRILVGSHFVKAAHLVDCAGTGARIARGKRYVEYHHLLLREHNVLLANGIGAESLFLGPETRRVLDKIADQGTVPDIPQLLIKPHTTTCRPTLKRHEVSREIKRLNLFSIASGRESIGQCRG